MIVDKRELLGVHVLEGGERLPLILEHRHWTDADLDRQRCQGAPYAVWQRTHASIMTTTGRGRSIMSYASRASAELIAMLRVECTPATVEEIEAVRAAIAGSAVAPEIQIEGP